MNLRNKILLTIFALGTIVGCDSLIYDDLKDCPQGVYVNFYSKTPCAKDSTFIGDVSGLYLFAFDEQQMLVGSTVVEKASLTRDYRFLMPLKQGYYTFVAWAGVDNRFNVPSFEAGVTKKTDLMLALQAQNKQAVALDAHRVWQGESPVVVLPATEKMGTIYKYTAVDLREVTNRIDVEVALHESIRQMAKPQDFVVELSAANGKANIDGSLVAGADALQYPAIVSHTDSSMSAKFTLMDLQTGYSNVLTIRNKVTGAMVWQGDLIGSILLKMPNANLACTHDFKIVFDIRDRCFECYTFMCWGININGWQIHSYKTELEDL